jgi:G3E family GTPase
LVGEIAPDVVLLNSGCLCCTLRGELRDALSSLLTRRIRAEIPPFKRVIVETTGIAQPSLILSTVFADPQIRHHYTVGDVVTTVDAMHAPGQSRTESVWLEQVASADDLLITKTDCIEKSALDAVLDLLERSNPTARRLYPDSPALPDLFSRSADAGDAARTRRKRIFGISRAPSGAHAEPHYTTVATVRIREEKPVDWESFGVWLSMLLHAHGNNILRVKGLLRIAESDGPVVIQGVQHVIHPPEHLPSWEGLEKATDLVFILRSLAPERIERSFRAFVRAW